MHAHATAADTPGDTGPTHLDMIEMRGLDLVLSSQSRSGDENVGPSTRVAHPRQSRVGQSPTYLSEPMSGRVVRRGHDDTRPPERRRRSW